jgi:hypothetical protein
MVSKSQKRRLFPDWFARQEARNLERLAIRKFLDQILVTPRWHSWFDSAFRNCRRLLNSKRDAIRNFAGIDLGGWRFCRIATIEALRGIVRRRTRLWQIRKDIEIRKMRKKDFLSYLSETLFGPASDSAISRMEKYVLNRKEGRRPGNRTWSESWKRAYERIKHLPKTDGNESRDKWKLSFQSISKHNLSFRKTEQWDSCVLQTVSAMRFR